MPKDPWIPVGTEIGKGVAGRLLQAGVGWQIYSDSRSGGRVLVLEEELAAIAVRDGFLSDDALSRLDAAPASYSALICGNEHQLSAVDRCASPSNAADALSFAAALRRSRELAHGESLANGIFIEKYSAILPITGRDASDDSVVLGRYLTGGVPISVTDRRRTASILSWLPPQMLDRICQTAGIIANAVPDSDGASKETTSGRLFALPGRPDLEMFFREHVIDIVENAPRYAKLGILFPGAIALFGPPGSGKTFAVDRLVDFLGWPRFEISSGSVGSPYIHETGRKVADIFERAAESAPAVLVIDEMEAFLTDRSASDGMGTHHVEEVAEFLRRIPEAAKQQVLVVAMTNRIDTIDAAILRRGRFDHVIEVGMASATEIRALLDDMLAALPHEPDVDTTVLAGKLDGRPLADVAFVLREAARMTARDGSSSISNARLMQAVAAAVPRSDTTTDRPRIGF